MRIAIRHPVSVANIIRRALVACTIAALAVLPACGGSDAGPTTPVDNYLPVISNLWRNIATPTHSLVLQSSDDNKASGSFTGTETHATFGTSAITGTFRNSAATFVIARAAGAVTYTGTFYGLDSLRLVRGSETLRFLKQ